MARRKRVGIRRRWARRLDITRSPIERWRFVYREHQRGQDEFGFVGLSALPSLHEIVFDTDLIQRPPDRLTNDVLDGFGMLIESRHRRQDDRP